MTDSLRPTVGVIGLGRLGASLAAALREAGYRLRAVAAHDLAPAEPGAGVLVGAPEDVLVACDLVFLTVQDGVIAPLAASLAWEPRHRAVHCSGALGLDVLAAAARAGAETGCFHPLQSFPSREPEPERFRGVYCGIEGTGDLAATLTTLAGSLGAHALNLSGANRALYHAAAVFSSNNVIALMAAAREAWTLAGLPPEMARPALAPLLAAVAKNIAANDLRDALTGPVARGDAGTVQRHLTALERAPALRELYRALGAELAAVMADGDAAETAALRERLGL